MAKKYKILLYNIGYGSGIGKNPLEYVYKVYAYLTTPAKVLDNISMLLKKIKPDIIALEEVSLGGLRSSFQNQAECIREKVNLSDAFYKCKYRGFFNCIPIIRNNGNAFISREKIKNRASTRLSAGIKNLVLEIKIGSLWLVLVHLSLEKSSRNQQIAEISELIKKNSRKNLIIMGDFNVRDASETSQLVKCNHLQLIKCPYNYPSWAPSKNLDLVFASKKVKISKISTISSSLSDHLPLVFEVKA